MKKFLFVFFALFLFFPLTTFAQEKKQAVYFYATWCSHCQKVDSFLKKNGFYEKYDIKKFNFDERENKILLKNVLDGKMITDGGIPAVVIDEEIFIGDVPIVDNFEKKMEASSGTALQYVEKFGGGKQDKVKEISKPKKDEPGENNKGVALPLLLGAAFSDAFNPCAFAVLILLVGTVLNSHGKRRALWAGLLFSLAIFISYFLMGLGLYRAITIFNIPKYFSLVVGVIAILVGLANLKDAFWYGKLFVMEVPLSWRPKMKSILKHATSPFGAFTSGLLVSLFLLPCSSGPYIVIVGLLAEKVNVAIATTQLALYNLIFILPMLVITFGMYFFNFQMAELEKMRRSNLKVLHAVVGTIMILMGLYLIQGWL
ncbi:MAG: Cytochrome c biogenesis protein [Candidatus Moranbacteria bacterium GW2011_GWE1_36_7]|nr:MAG: Cytochrome c biogenesis protein [Candidatus Moranbacteria bacterium GW2011_GWD2_36_12]KKQ04722.1 MAG: Cytochrome c biogenesis protein [Candidatus Moranbacteria bacterium GW2011_GWE2_36_40]KKQ14341.1 MAG: Cytochrome c biogenesis protein [Candidatus Moranbacteria bacterium GW2011_GWE1_36_7]